jgi:uncharacterized protein YjiS (DUF1127 family)
MDATHIRLDTRHSRLPDWLGSIAAWLGACLECSRQRRDLADLDDHLLKDVGLSRADVARECGHWPWDGPPTAKLGGASVVRLGDRPLDNAVVAVERQVPLGLYQCGRSIRPA